MMGGMGGMGMGGMGMGGMGGMGGGMMGGMGGGFRSIPPTGLPHATLRPNQTRGLPTRLVSLVGPTTDGKATLPAKGEKLQLGDSRQILESPLAQAALKKLAEDKAPTTIAQLVSWNVIHGMDWETIAALSKSWANAHEVALAKQFVENLRKGLRAQEQVLGFESGSLYFELTGRPEGDATVADLRKLLEGNAVLGLSTKAGIPDKPSGPGLSIRVNVDNELAQAQVLSSDPSAYSWVTVGKVQVNLKDDQGKNRKPIEVADALAEGLLSRVTEVTLVEGPKVKGKPTYKIQILNNSPFVLNGLALAGKEAKETQPAALAGFCVAPHKTLTVPASGELVQRLGLKDGIRLLAADLSGL